MIIKNEILKKKKLFFNEKLFTGEDQDFCKNLSKNFKINFLGKIWVNHKTKNIKNYIFERLIYGKAFVSLLKTKNIAASLKLIAVLFFTIFNSLFILYYFILSKYLIIIIYLLFIYLIYFFDFKININSNNYIIQPMFNLFASCLPAIGVLCGAFIKEKYYRNSSDV